MEYTQKELIEISKIMQATGGHFASGIGTALEYADDENKERLLKAFPELIKEFHALIKR